MGKSVKVILLESSNVGKVGELVDVKVGFAKNYLIKQKKALWATEDNLAKLEQQLEELKKKDDERKTQAQVIADKIEGAVLEFVVQSGSDGKLFGSVGKRQINKYLLENHQIDPSEYSVDLSLKVKRIGAELTDLMFYSGIKAQIEIIVGNSEEQIQQIKEGTYKTEKEIESELAILEQMKYDQAEKDAEEGVSNDESSEENSDNNNKEEEKSE